MLKLDMQGAIAHSIRTLTLDWVYSISLSVDGTKIIGVGHEIRGGIMILNTADMSELFFNRMVETSTLKDVVSNGVDKWYAVGGF